MLLGDREAALDELERSLREPNGVTSAQLGLDCLWDPLRKEPRFQRLAAGAVPLPAGR